ncbi:MAG: heavy metal translocating P-type ATPase, partial [Verrucomicrobiia bacterium]
MTHVGVNDKPDAEKRITVSEFSISGMTCQNCARRAAQAIQSVAGVESVTVDLAAGAATVRWLPGASPEHNAVVETVRRTGFSARLRGPGQAGAETRSRSRSDTWRTNIIIGLAAVVPLAIGEWVFHLHGKAWFAWASFLLALVVQVFCGARFYRGAWAQLKARSANMDTLVALGSTAAFGFSVYLLFSGLPGHLYFLESTAILTLISLGHLLEARATEQAASALKSLLRLSPSKARRLAADQSEVEVPIDSLRPGDIVVVRPGDNIPTDGVVLDGRAAVDESMLTGEAAPVEKGPGAFVYGGTLNPDGRLIVRVTATGEHSALAKIIAAVKRAQNSRANIQRIGDRVSSVFVPVVVAIAIAAGLWWWSDYDSAMSVARVLSRYLWPAAVPETALAAAFINAVAVLIVACPCAMGLATPAAIMAATNVAARRGFLVRDGVALEKAGEITTVVFDKTGTLTMGKPIVTAVKHLRPDAPAKEPVEMIAASLAAPSNHLVSRAIACLLNTNGRGLQTTRSEP